MKPKRIYAEVRTLPESKFDKIPLIELAEMVGWIEPPEGKGKEWIVTMVDGSYFVCKNQETAQLMASLEEIKALLLKRIK